MCYLTRDWSCGYGQQLAKHIEHQGKFGVGVSGGTELMAYIAREVFEEDYTLPLVDQWIRRGRWSLRSRRIFRIGDCSSSSLSSILRIEPVDTGYRDLSPRLKEVAR